MTSHKSSERQHEILMKYHGKSLEEHIYSGSKPLTHFKILQYLYNLLDLLEVLHESGYAHGNLKPKNIAINQKEKVHLVGFTSSNSFVNKNGQHLRDQKEFAQTGNLTFASMHACRGSSLSRRDDIESLIYLFVSLTCNQLLPWVKFQKEVIDGTLTREDLRSLRSCDQMQAEVVKILPEGFKEYYVSVCNLKYEDKPNYEQFRLLLE